MFSCWPQFPVSHEHSIRQASTTLLTPLQYPWYSSPQSVASLAVLLGFTSLDFCSGILRIGSAEMLMQKRRERQLRGQASR